MMIKGTKLFIETQMSEWDLLFYCKTLDLKIKKKRHKDFEGAMYCTFAI